MDGGYLYDPIRILRSGLVVGVALGVFAAIVHWPIEERGRRPPGHGLIAKIRDAPVRYAGVSFHPARLKSVTKLSKSVPAAQPLLF